MCCGENKGAGKPENEDTEFYDPIYGLGLAPYMEKEDMLGIHHLARYHWAKDVLGAVAPKSLLDIACGSGYGSYILAEGLGGCSVTGADYDARAAVIAQAKYQRENLRFIQGNLVTWKSSVGDSDENELGRYDAIVSFDTIEHLLHREIALMQIVKHMEPGGVLLLSTPCAHETTKLNPGWEHHKIEYSHYDLVDLLKRYFRQVLLPEEGRLPGLEYWTEVINKDKIRYPNISNPVFCSEPILV